MSAIARVLYKDDDRIMLLALSDHRVRLECRTCGNRVKRRAFDTVVQAEEFWKQHAQDGRHRREAERKRWESDVLTAVFGAGA